MITLTRMIEGVKIIELNQISDERGKVMHMLRRDSEHFIDFGEIYFSCVFPDVIKAWHLHKRMTLNYAVVSGSIKFVLYDEREGSSTKGSFQEIFISPENYCLVIVPPNIWNGFKGLSEGMSIIANCATIPHDPDEIVRLEPNTSQIQYDWSV